MLKKAIFLLNNIIEEKKVTDEQCKELKALVTDMEKGRIRDNTPSEVNTDYDIKVKAFDGKDRVKTYSCYPCPACRKWIVNNPNTNYCSNCGQRIIFVVNTQKKE